MTERATVSRLLYDHKWYQVWIDDCVFYVLILFCSLDGDYAVYDPKEEQIVERFELLEDAKGWLSEDEYTPISVRLKDLEEYVKDSDEYLTEH